MEQEEERFNDPRADNLDGSQLILLLIRSDLKT